MPDLSDLIARVEAASGPDRELDLAIAEAAGVKHGHTCDDNGIIHPCWGNVLRYSASLDAAVSLVPGGMAWTVLAISGAEPATHSPSAVVSRYHALAATPALALCAAALRARMAADA
jgi:hypothetical protein